MGAGESAPRGGLLPGTVRRGGRRQRFIQLGDQPSQTIEIILQATLRVGVGVVEEADRPAVAAGANLPDQREVEMPRAQRLDLAAGGLAVGVHAVQVEAKQVRQQLRQELVEPLDHVMGVVEVVDDADVAHAFGAKGLDHGEEVLGAAKPTAMIVEGDRAALRRARLADRLEPGDFGRHARPLVGGVLDGDRTTLPHHPELGVDIMPAKEGERGLRLVVQGRRKPPTLEFDSLLLQGRQLGVPLRHMLGAIVVDEAAEPQTREHRRPLLRSALLGVERHDAPSDEIAALEDRLGPGEGQQGQEKGADRTHGDEAETSLRKPVCQSIGGKRRLGRG